MNTRSLVRRRIDVDPQIVGWGIAAWLLLWGLIGGMVVANLASPTDAVGIRYDFADFRDTTWTPVVDFLCGQLPWDTESYMARNPNAQPFLLYTPHYWPLALFLQILPYPLVVSLWIGISTGCVTLLVAASMVRWLPGVVRRAPWMMVLGGIFFAFTPPGKYALFTGNWVSVCAPAAAGLLLVKSSRSKAALLLAAVVKPQVGIPASLVALGQRQVRGVVTAALVSVVLVLPVVVMAAGRAGGLTPLMRVLGGNLRAADEELAVNALPQVDAAHLASQLLGDSGPWALIATIVVALLTGVLAVWAGSNAPGSAAEALGVGLAILLILPNLLYTALALVPAIIALISEIVGLLCGCRLGRDWEATMLRVMLLVLVGFPFMNFYRLFPLFGASVGLGYVVNACCLNAAALLSLLLLKFPCQPSAVQRLAS